MTEAELDNEIAGMWNYLRQQGDMVSDAPARKIGMPWVAPYEGVCFPVEIDGRFSVVSIDAEQVARFALGQRHGFGQHQPRVVAPAIAIVQL